MMTDQRPLEDTIAELEGLIDGETDRLACLMQEVVALLKHQSTLKVVRCDEHDYVVVFLDDELVYQHEHNTNEPPKGLLLMAEHLGWSVEIETIDSREFERRYA
jgi:hypothetical protein